MNRCVAVVVGVFSVTVAQAQSAGVPANPAQTQSAGVPATSPPATPVGAAPISPVAIAFERTTMQTLADGTHINRTTHERFYRDSLGRTRTEFEINSPANQLSAPRTNVIIYDPVAGQTISWLSGQGLQQTYTVTRTPRGPLYVPQTTSATRDPGLRAAPAPKAPSSVPASSRPAINREDLGTEQVQGAACHATRYTTVYPVGSIGNDRSITVVRESCMSREFGRLLSDHTADPRNGIRTLTVTSLTRADPDPALFQPPADFQERPTSAPPASQTARPAPQPAPPGAE